MPSYKYIAILALLNLSNVTSAKLRGSASPRRHLYWDDYSVMTPSTVTEQLVSTPTATTATLVDVGIMEELTELTASFGAFEHLIDGVDTTKTQNDDTQQQKLTKISSFVTDTALTLENIEGLLTSRGASEEEWKTFGDALSRFQEIQSALVVRIEEVNAYTDTEVEDFEDEEENEVEDEGDFEEEEGQSSADLPAASDRMRIFDELNSSFETLQQAMDGVNVDQTSTADLGYISSIMEQTVTGFGNVREDMVRFSADEGEWQMFQKTLNRFKGLQNTFTEKLLGKDESADVDNVDNSDSEQLKSLIEIILDTDNAIESEGVDFDGLQAQLDYAKSALSEMEQTAAVFEIKKLVDALQDKLSLAVDDTVPEQIQEEVRDEEETEQQNTLAAAAVVEEEDVAFTQQQDFFPVNYDKEESNHAKLMSKFAFPDGSQVNVIVQTEGGAYALNVDEKKVLMQNEDTYRRL